ncbi:hypothetical protein OTB20_08385 [Streptomyces sp. H27-H1]|uniref:hypothetical protein n=1 Tax=Streptomyces sp. H27-H1 TaxID=2996461 RepID=UPI00226E958A|nr:hypothetical protein [Streptomyces sp. H27-H1]MCY0926222.1 hypothetical protein [Streptomyces sp. H27-H1]
MPGIDDLGQGIPYPLLSDPPNIESALSSMVDSAVPRMNMRFANANARAATIPSPVAGMECYLIAEKRKELYDGAAWVTITPSGWVPITFASGYQARAGSPSYRILNSCVELRGSVQRVGFTPFIKGTGFSIATLPTICRPPHYRTYAVATEWATDMYARLEVTPDGEVEIGIPTITGTAARWLCLDGVRYSLI